MTSEIEERVGVRNGEVNYVYYLCNQILNIYFANTSVQRQIR